MAERETDFGAFLTGFLLGAVVGGVTALLLAPQPGEETRALIKDKSIELKDKATETAEEYRARIGSTASETRARADEYIKRGQQVLDEQLKRVQETIGKVSTDKGAPAETAESETESGVEASGA